MLFKDIEKEAIKIDMVSIEDIEREAEASEWNKMISEVKKSINQASDTPVKSKNEDKKSKEDGVGFMRQQLYLRHLIRDKRLN